MFQECHSILPLIIVIFSISFLTISVFILSRKYKLLYLDALENSISLNEKYVELQKKYNEVLKSPELKRESSLELKEFLNDLTSGEALISVSRVDPSNVFLYSPRDKR